MIERLRPSTGNSSDDLPPLLPGRIAHTLCSLLLLLFGPSILAAQTIYAVVLGNQDFVVGSSTLRSGLFVRYEEGGEWHHVGPENLKAYSMDAVDSSEGKILYIAAGNGVHRSTDYGATWKIVTDWRMTEVLDVMVDQRQPSTIYAATAFGFWRSTDSGVTWENPDGPLRNSYCYRIMGAGDSTIALWTSSSPEPEYLSDDRGESWRINSHADSVAPLRMPGRTYDLSSRLNGLVGIKLAYTDGPMVFIDLGFSTRRRELTDVSIFSLLYSRPIPGEPEIALLHINAPTEAPVHALAWDGNRFEGPLLAGTFGDGIFRLQDDEWYEDGLEGSQVWRIVRKEYSVSERIGHVHE